MLGEDIGKMKRLLRKKIHLWREAEGLSAVEFAIVMPVLLLMLGGIIDVGNYYYVKSTVNQAAETGARLAAVGQYTQVVSTIHSKYGDQYTVTLNPTTPISKGTVTVTVRTPVTFNFPFISSFFPNQTATGQCVMYVE
jgi:uncharacterized membrane protein